MILYKTHPDTIHKTSKALIEGKVVIIPTDTVYGFSGIVPISDALIRNIKGREETKPFIQLVASAKDIAHYSNTPIPSKIAHHMPGPLTIIVKNMHDDGTTAFRCPDDPWLQKLLQICKKPLYTTSVNRSGKEIIHNVLEMEKEFSNEVFCIVDAQIPDIKNQVPSTIVDITNNSINIIRQGSIYIN